MSYNKFDTSSSDRHEAITTSDTVDLPKLTRGLYVGGAGNVAVVGTDDVVTIFTGALVGSILPVVAKRVNATSTTATSLIALY